MILKTSILVALGATAGFMAGFYLCARYSSIAYSNLYDAAIEALKKQSNTYNKAVYNRVRNKVMDVNRIMEEQLALWGKVDGPNRGPSHSKWKKSIIDQINDLESDKVDAFRDILDEGMDLNVSVMDNNGKKSSKKISEIISDFDNKSNKTSTPVKENDSNKNLRAIKPKLTLIKDDSYDGQPT